MAGCKEQDATPQGDGCGSDLSWWLSPAPYLPPPKPKVPPKPRPQITLADLPAACADVLAAPGVASGAAVAAEAAPAASASKASIPLPPARPSGK